MTATETQVHATCVSLEGTGVLLRGPSGAGKSDLALRLMDGGARLVADDRVDLTLQHGKILAAAPAALAGRLEVRGLGVLPVDYQADVLLGLIVDLISDGDALPRLPDVRETSVLGCTLPWLQVHPFEASAAAKLRLAVCALPWNDISDTPPP